MRESKKVTNHDQKREEKHLKRKVLSQRVSRDAMLSMKLKKSTPFSKYIGTPNNPLNTAQLKATFFSDKHPLKYSREHPLKKLIASQYILQSKQSETLKSFPFVFRLSHQLMKLDEAQLKRKIRAALKSVSGKIPLYWFTTEYNVGGIRNRHINGEILINPTELPKLKKALTRLYGSSNAGVDHALRFPTGSRANQIQKHGEFYAVYNWCGYATKENTRLTFEQKLNNEIKKERLYSISSELNSEAKKFHESLMCNKVPTETAKASLKRQTQKTEVMTPITELNATKPHSEPLIKQVWAPPKKTMINNKYGSW